MEHFAELLTEAIKLQMDGHNKIAAEFSGGIDSSSIITGFKQLDLEPVLFMHTAHNESTHVDDSSYANVVIHQYKLNNYHSINAENFDLLGVVRKCSQLFAGAPQYLFPIGANNIHRAVTDAGYTLLFSGFGGDECVSSHAPLATCLREYLSHNNYRQAWHELNAYYTCNNLPKPTKSRLGLTIIKNSYPQFFGLIQQFPELFTTRQMQRYNIPTPLAPNSASLHEYEYTMLQGQHSHHIRLRVEESAIVDKAMGFSYKYPLLYPKLVEFCHRLPLQQKRKHGENRLLIRKYLAQYLPSSVYQKHQKVGGIMPATMHKIKQEYAAGKYWESFNNLPLTNYAALIRRKYPNNPQAQLLQELVLYGLKFSNNG